MAATVRRAVQDGHRAAALRRGTRAVGMGRKARCRVAASCTSPGRKNLRDLESEMVPFLWRGLPVLPAAPPFAFSPLSRYAALVSQSPRQR